MNVTALFLCCHTDAPGLLFQVTWKAPFLQTGDILSYKICMPDPLITIPNRTSSHPFHQLLDHHCCAFSRGNGYLGGCTESLPTSVTPPSSPASGTGPIVCDSTKQILCWDFLAATIQAKWTKFEVEEKGLFLCSLF